MSITWNSSEIPPLLKRSLMTFKKALKGGSLLGPVHSDTFAAQKGY